MHKEAERNGIQVISRAAAILRVLRDSQTGLSLGQIAERTRLPRSTVQRIVGALADERFVISSGAAGGLRLGPELQSLSEASRHDVAETCRPFLVALARDTQETADLSVFRGAMIFLDQIAGSQRLRAVSHVGDVFPLTTTANGRAALALMNDAQVERLTLAEWARGGRGGDLAALMGLIGAVRREGVAFDRDEHTVGICAIGIAFADWGGEIHAISVPMPSARFAQKEAPVTAELLRLKVRLDALFRR